MRAWGFEPTAMGFVWIKLNPLSSPHFFTPRDIFKGGGFTTRKNAEFVHDRQARRLGADECRRRRGYRGAAPRTLAQAG
jgi:hypothetical protein